MYCLPCVRAVVDALREAIGDPLDDLVPLAVVDDVALEVEVSPMTVLSCVKNDTYCYNRFTIFLSR